MKEIKRDLGYLKNLVTDAEEKEQKADYRVSIPLTESEVEDLKNDFQADVIILLAVELAKQNELSRDFDEDDWENFRDEMYYEVKYYEYTTDESFMTALTKKVGSVLESMQAKVYEVTTIITMSVTIPVFAKNEDDAGSWVENMSEYELSKYLDRDGDITDISADRVEATNESKNSYGDCEDAT